MKHLLAKIIFRTRVVNEHQMRQLEMILRVCSIIFISFLVFIFVMFMVSILTTTDDRLSSAVFANFMGYLSMVIGSLFAYHAYKFTKRFSPVVLQPIFPKKELVLVVNETVLTTTGINVNDIVNDVSGDVKAVYILAQVRKSKMDNLKQWTLKNVSRYSGSLFLYARQVIFHLSPDLEYRMQPNSETSEEVARRLNVTFFMGYRYNTNIIFFLYEDFSGEIYPLMYLLYISYEKDTYLVYYPIIKYQMYDLDYMYAIYKNIDLKTDIFWKNENIKSFEVFQNKVISQYKKMEEEFMKR